ncbi:hypothetical protein D0T85_22380 [Bacteroides sp. 519]|nr:hypothetical protein [Bacteroides sp. 519]
MGPKFGKQMKAVSAVVSEMNQEHIAAESRIAFWNMFEAMGGDGSIAEFVRSCLSSSSWRMRSRLS